LGERLAVACITCDLTHDVEQIQELARPVAHPVTSYENPSCKSGRNWRWLTPAARQEFIESRDKRFEPGIRKHHFRQVVGLTGSQYP
jgi:hypothetical protein